MYPKSLHKQYTKNKFLEILNKYKLLSSKVKSAKSQEIQLGAPLT
ncbi:hypothetical protein HMPREF1321_0988 [Capnocytophaga sp. oral taxon 412 str. F0487]|nr:hypothetical protein HMPREF1321_0988 [Capnocytophaga sp. oral taxon 412 str. F0487]